MSLLTALGLASMVFVAWFTMRAYSSTAAAGGAQSRRESIIEAWVNIAIGFSINFTVNLWVIPLMTDGAHLSAANNFWGGWMYTAISILRQYAIRRWFNAGIHTLTRALAQRLSTLASAGWRWL